MQNRLSFSDLNQTLREFLLQNPLVAFDLHAFGIDYLAFQHNSLRSILHSNLAIFARLKSAFEKPQERDESISMVALQSKSVHWLVQYLVDQHHGYLKRHLPFSENLMLQLQCAYPQLETCSMRFVRFKRQFLQHLEHEEQALFPFLRHLQSLSERNPLLHEIIEGLNRFSLESFERQHERMDKSFEEVNEVLQTTLMRYRFDLQCVILLGEMDAISKDLECHEFIEDHVLIPKVRLIQQDFLTTIAYKSRLN